MHNLFPVQHVEIGTRVIVGADTGIGQCVFSSNLTVQSHNVLLNKSSMS
jgi:UDP-3-O-[3-hydroxymyristoyl] glucosamine N-acyltransferase